MDEQAIDVFMLAGKIVSTFEVDIVAEVSAWVGAQIRWEILQYYLLKLLNLKFGIDRMI